MAITINGSGTLTGITAGGLPDAIITQPELAANVAGNGPAFSAYQNASQNVSNGVLTKVVLQAELFDTNNNFDKDTNYRFQPSVAGYYQFFGQATMANPANSNGYLNGAIYKNGSALIQSASTQPTNGNYASAYCSGLIYCNGSSDYIEFYTAHNNFAVNPQVTIPNDWTYFTGFLARAA
jgi:hypothetical protein